MLRVPLPPMFAYYSSAFGDTAQRLRHLLLKTAITEFTIMSLGCFIADAEPGVAHIFMPARLRVLAEDGRLCVNEGVLLWLPSKIRATVLSR